MNKEVQSSSLSDKFVSGSVSRAVLRNVLPAIAAMLMVLVYNLADTFFIGQTHNDYMVAAVSIATPVFLLFMSIGTLFGMGGTSVISRALGRGDTEYAKKACSFCMWASIGTGIIFTLIIIVFINPILRLLGAKDETWSYTRSYLLIVACCGVFSIISNCYTNIIRTEGKSTVAMAGTLIGNLLNVVLDPIMILSFNWGIVGAAIATFIGNAVGALYYLLYFWRGKSALSIHIRDYHAGNKIASGVLSIGIPASLGSILMSISQILANSLMSAYGVLSVAAYGVAAKVLMIVTLVGIGVGQGIQPLLGYCYGAGNRKRFLSSLRFSMIFSLFLCAGLALLCYLFAAPIVEAFLTEPNALDYGVLFSQIMLTSSWLFGIYYVLMNALQAVGAAVPSLIISISRQGIIYIPSLYILHSLIGITGIAWAQPVADVLSLLLEIVLYVNTIRKDPKLSASK
jgi:multidrug efflux pump